MNTNIQTYEILEIRDIYILEYNMYFFVYIETTAIFFSLLRFSHVLHEKFISSNDG